jgi:hypothetical protein
MQACYAAGSETELAQRLQVPVELLVKYLLGETQIPNDLFLRAADLALERHARRIAGNGKWLEDFLKRHAH